MNLETFKAPFAWPNTFHRFKLKSIL